MLVIAKTHTFVFNIISICFPKRWRFAYLGRRSRSFTVFFSYTFHSILHYFLRLSMCARLLHFNPVMIVRRHLLSQTLSSLGNVERVCVCYHFFPLLQHSRFTCRPDLDLILSAERCNRCCDDWLLWARSVSSKMAFLVHRRANRQLKVNLSLLFNDLTWKTFDCCTFGSYRSTKLQIDSMSFFWIFLYCRTSIKWKMHSMYAFAFFCYKVYGTKLHSGQERLNLRQRCWHTNVSFCVSVAVICNRLFNYVHVQAATKFI